MPNHILLDQLDRFVPYDAEEAAMVAHTRQFVTTHEDCMDRLLQIGHITGSAWILDGATQGHALLTHHRKLGKWFQLGGHSEGENDVLAVAWREAQEESGLSSLRLLDKDIFSVDVHPIPARRDFPEHLHFDIRFLFVANREEPLLQSAESTDLRWVALETIEKLNNSPSVMRMVAKSIGSKMKI